MTTTTLTIDELERELLGRRSEREQQKAAISRKLGEARRTIAQAKAEAEHEIRVAVSQGRDHDTAALRERMTEAERLVEESTLALRQVDSELAALDREHEALIANHRRELVELAVTASGHASEALDRALKMLEAACVVIDAADRAWVRAMRGVGPAQLARYRERVRGFASDATRPLGAADDLIVLEEPAAAHDRVGRAYFRPLAIMREVARKLAGRSLAPRAYLPSHGGDRGQGLPGVYVSTSRGSERVLGFRDTQALGSDHVQPDEFGFVEWRRVRDLTPDEAHAHPAEVRHGQAVVEPYRPSGPEPDQYDRARGVELDAVDPDAPAEPFLEWLG